MGHHHISEVNDEKYIFTGRSKANSRFSVCSWINSDIYWSESNQT